MAKAQRFTKKMLVPLDKAELRKIAIVGMGLEPLDAYTMKEPDVISWIHERADEFAGISLESVGEDTFRPGVATYVAQLQEFILKKRTAPNFPPDSEEIVDNVVELPVEPAVEEPPKRRRGRPRKTDAEKEASKKTTKKATAKKSEPAKKASEKKSTGGRFKKVAETHEDAVARQAVSGAFDEGVEFASAALLEKVAAQAERVASLEAQLQAMRQEQTDAFNLLHNAVVFLINTLVIDEGDPMIKDLVKVPNPEKYVK